METHGGGGSSRQKRQASEPRHTTHHAGRPPRPKHNTEPKGLLYYQFKQQNKSLLFTVGDAFVQESTHTWAPQSTLTTDRDGVRGPAWSTHPTFGHSDHSPWVGVACQAGICPHLSSSGRRPPGGREGNLTQQETHSKVGDVQLGPSTTPASSTEKSRGPGAEEAMEAQVWAVGPADGVGRREDTLDLAVIHNRARAFVALPASGRGPGGAVPDSAAA